MSISHQQQNELRHFNHPHKNNTSSTTHFLDFSQKNQYGPRKQKGFLKVKQKIMIFKFLKN